jgi:hypothetical protein
MGKLYFLIKERALKLSGPSLSTLSQAVLDTSELHGHTQACPRLRVDNSNQVLSFNLNFDDIYRLQEHNFNI